MFKEFFNDNYAYKSHKSNETCDPTKLKDHFEKHFQLPNRLVMPDEIRQMPEYMKHLQDIPIDSMRQGPPDEEEIIEAVKKLKNGKSSFDIPAELLKASSKSPIVLEMLLKMFDEIWQKRCAPADFGNTKMTAIFKNKGDIKDPRMYRMIQTSKLLSKLLSIILLQRMKTCYEMQIMDYQLAF